MYIVWFTDGTRFRLYCEEDNILEEGPQLLDSHNRYYKKNVKIACVLIELEPLI
jgi:hypothetical protein